MSQAHSLTGRLAIPLFMDRFGRSLRVCQLEFDKEAISDGYMSKNARYWWVGVWRFIPRLIKKNKLWRGIYYVLQ